eukprot:5167881-Amphidinium_carterae.1
MQEPVTNSKHAEASDDDSPEVIIADSNSEVHFDCAQADMASSVAPKNPTGCREVSRRQWPTQDRQSLAVKALTLCAGMLVSIECLRDARARTQMSILMVRMTMIRILTPRSGRRTRKKRIAEAGTPNLAARG